MSVACDSGMNARKHGPASVTVAISALGLALALVAGCRDDRPREVGTTTTTGANIQAVSNETAVARIVASRCAREATCNNVGVDKKFQNPAGCTAKIRSDMKDDLNPKDCTLGVDQKQLDECLDAIRKEECNNPLDTIQRLGACRTSAMCLKSTTR